MQRDFESSVRAVYQAVLKNGDHAIDVGAHVGDHSIGILEKITPNGHLYAFEPLPTKLKEMSERISSYFPGWRSNISYYNCALSDHEGHEEFIVAVDAPWYSGLKARVYDEPTRVERIQTELRTLDTLFGDMPNLKYIKVDAEGGEYHILRGGRELIQRHRPLVTFEFGGNSISEYNITGVDMWELWQELSYDLYDIDGVQLTKMEEFLQRVELQLLWDYVAVPHYYPEMATAVREALAVKRFLK